MSNITIGRYEHESITKTWSGWIEPADKSWIIWLDTTKHPALYYAHRDANGGVIGNGKKL